MGMVAPNAHHMGRTKSAISAKTVNVSQKIFRSMLDAASLLQFVPGAVAYVKHFDFPAFLNASQSIIARLESGWGRPSTRTLGRLAAATGTRLKISFALAA